GTEQRFKAFFFDKEDRIEPVLRSVRLEPVAEIEADAVGARAGIRRSPQILAHFKSSERHQGTGMRFGEVAAGIPNDIPFSALFGMLVDVVDEQVLREIRVVEAGFAGEIDNSRASLVHDLPGFYRQVAAASGTKIGPLHEP